VAQPGSEFYPLASGVEADGKKNIEKKNRKKPQAPRTKLRLPDLDHAKTVVLLSLRSPESQRGYRHAIDEFIFWYCSEPRLSFNKTVVTRYKGFLEDRHLASGTINVRLAAVRRLAYEAADAGLLSPELAAGIRRVKGAKKLGTRLGNWLTAPKAQSLLSLPALGTIGGKRDRAILGIMLENGDATQFSVAD
jgi:hypothetical protein